MEIESRGRGAMKEQPAIVGWKVQHVHLGRIELVDGEELGEERRRAVLVDGPVGAGCAVLVLVKELIDLVGCGEGREEGEGCCEVWRAAVRVELD